MKLTIYQDGRLIHSFSFPKHMVLDVADALRSQGYQVEVAQV